MIGPNILTSSVKQIYFISSIDGRRIINFLNFFPSTVFQENLRASLLQEALLRIYEQGALLGLPSLLLLLIPAGALLLFRMPIITYKV